VPDSGVDGAGEVTDPQPVGQATALGRDGPGGKEEDVADLCAPFALDGELQHSLPTWAEARQRAQCFGGRALSHMVLNQPVSCLLPTLSIWVFS
jgi:hypothetical protein